MTTDELVDILVVEDNDSERDSIVLALEATIPDVSIIAVNSGELALDFLFSRGAWSRRVDEPPPRLILLDLAMPGSDGISVLGQIRSFDAKDSLTLTPVVIFTGSTSRTDIAESYRCGANSYIIKPLSYPDFQAIVQAVGNYWITYNNRTT